MTSSYLWPQYAGTAITTTATFTNPGSLVPVDPSTVTLKFQSDEDAAVTTWVYGGAGNIVRSSAGVYFAELDTTGQPGEWTVEWIGTGACASVNVSQFLVTPDPI